MYLLRKASTTNGYAFSPAILSAQHEIIDMPHIRKTLGMLEKALDRRDLLPLLNDLIHRADLRGK